MRKRLFIFWVPGCACPVRAARDDASVADDTMPELPEVETVRRQLDERLRGARIRSVQLLRSGREFPVGVRFIGAIQGKKIQSIDRRAKLLVWRFDDGTAMTAHLKMTGRFVFVEPDYVPQKHDRVVFETEVSRLVWADVRQFGFLKIVSGRELEEVLESYGLEPLEVSENELAETLRTKSARTIKAALLDQTLIAGVGNIYADEALHRAGIRPTRRVASLTEAERLRVAQGIRSVLSESLAQRGTSANDYVDTEGSRGGFLELLRVYGREGEPCRNCGELIKRIVVVQRGTHYCPGCQH